MSDRTDLVDRQIAAYQERDLNAFLAFYANGCQDPPIRRQRRRRRHRRPALFLRAAAPRQPRTQGADPAPDRGRRLVIDEEETTGVNVPGYPATVHAVVIYQVKDGLIHEFIFLA
jgi:hypothetical protein